MRLPNVIPVLSVIVILLLISMIVRLEMWPSGFFWLAFLIFSSIGIVLNYYWKNIRDIKKFLLPIEISLILSFILFFGSNPLLIIAVATPNCEPVGFESVKVVDSFVTVKTKYNENFPKQPQIESNLTFKEGRLIVNGNYSSYKGLSSPTYYYGIETLDPVKIENNNAIFLVGISQFESGSLCIFEVSGQWPKQS